MDIHTRRGQDRQSVGIPIGPDTSLVLAELVLAQVDAEVASVFRGPVRGFRYYDDYEVFTTSRTLADEFIARLTASMANWQLILNPHKVTVDELPVATEDEWVSILKRMRLSDNSSAERSDINALFDEAVRLARRFPRETVLAYSLGQIITREYVMRHRVNRQNWPHLLNLLLQAALGEPGLLPRIGILARWARDRGWAVPRAVIGPAINLLVRDAARRGYASEVAWGLWVATNLGVPIRAPAAEAVAALVDDVVAIVALDARDKGWIASLDVSNWAPLMTRASLTGDHWLLAYEAHIHGWLPSADGSDYIATEAAFGHLRRNNIRFYDESIELPPPVRKTSSASRGTESQYTASASPEDVPELSTYE